MFQGTVLGWTKDSPLGNSFIGLVDTPAAYLGFAYSPLRVGPLEDRIEFAMPRFTSIDLFDTDASNIVSLVWNEDDVADRTLNILVNGGDRSLTIEADSIINQDLTDDAIPFFAGVAIDDTDASNHLTVIWNEDDVADRTLNILVVGGDRSLTIEADSIVNQDLTDDAVPFFAGIAIDDLDASNHLRVLWNEDDVADRTLNLSVVGGDRALTIEADSIVNQDLTTDGDVLHRTVRIDKFDLQVYNNSGAQLDAERVVKVVDHNVAGDLPQAEYLASYDDSPQGLVMTNIADGGPGTVRRLGVFTVPGLNTATSTAGDKLYCDDTGVLTAVATNFEVGIILTPAAANSVVFMNIGGGGAAGSIEVTATVILAEAMSGSADDMLFVKETETLYRYETAGAAYVDDNTYVLSTADGGNTRWLAIGGKYHYLNLATMTRVGALTVDGAINLINTNLALYVVPALAYPQRIKITAVNRNSGSTARVRIAHIDGAIGAIANEDYAWYDISLLDNESKWIELDGMSPADTILVRSDLTDVNFIATAVVLADNKGFSRIAATTVAADTNTALITTAGAQYEECSLLVCNRSAVDASYRFALIDGAIGAIADEDYIVYNELITANESLNFGETFHLPDGYTLAVRSTTADVNFILYGKQR